MSQAKTTKLKKQILYPTISTILGGVILYALSKIYQPIGLFFVNLFSSIGKFLTTYIAIQIWLVIVLVISAAILLLFILGIFIAAIFPKKRIVTFRDYQEDTVDNIIWRWSYKGDALDFDSFTPFCPECFTRLFIKKGYKSVEFDCDHCEHVIDIVYMQYSQYIDKVLREIERRISINEWKVKVKEPPKINLRV
jgi:hypothetical protein